MTCPLVLIGLVVSILLAGALPAAADEVSLLVDGPGGYLPGGVDQSAIPTGVCGGECIMEGGVWICPVCPPTPSPASPDIEISIRKYGMDRLEWGVDEAGWESRWNDLFARIQSPTDGPRLPDLWAELDRIAGGNLTLEELKIVMGVAHGWNVTADGYVILPDGTTEDLRRWAKGGSGRLEFKNLY